MKLTCCTEDGRVAEIEASPETTFGDLKAIAAAEFNSEPANIVVSFKGDMTIANSETLRNQGVADEDMLLIIINNGGNALARSQPNRQPQGNQNLLESLLPPQFRNLDFNRLFNPNAQPNQDQRRANQQKINENYELAMQESPESFASVYMLYIDVEINGTHVKAFVDSGAQTTIMSKKCAIATGMIDLIDPRFAGVAMGVGAAKIIGKVHLAPLKIGDNYYNASFSVLDQVQDVDLLIGLDVLKRYQCCIDLAKDCLHIGTTDQTVPFLGEADLPAHARLNGTH